MRPDKEIRDRLRRVRFETFEERLALSAQPVADALTNEPFDNSIEHHYGDFLLEQIETVASQVESTLAAQASSAHVLTGVDMVRSTYGFTGVGQTVAIIDSGIAYDHQALGAGYGAEYRVVGGWDFAENDANPYDDGPAGFHGTHVAGVVGSTNTKYSGVATGVDLVALRVFDDKGAGNFTWTEQALRWVHEHRNDFANPITTINLSLGTTWNANDPPSYAMLEDEFALLKADGIFISVSAGNSFTKYNAAGLSYPAASPYVVPVSSVDNNGNLSSFSQRNSRVLAAPGRNVMSTVPDYVLGADGIKNDYAAASGTSMAAPYVAGASALVRQAMQFVGYAGITQDTIYNHLRNTADVVFDSITNANYFRINVQRAIDALMPTDDYGSTSDKAHSLGTLKEKSTLAGVVGSLADQDHFTFTAGSTGKATFTFNVTNELQLAAKPGSGGSFANNQLTFEVVAGQTYSFSLATAKGIGRYTANVAIESTAVDLGKIDLQQLNNQSITGQTWFQMTAAREGIFTIETRFDHALGNIDVEVYNANQQLIVASKTGGNVERIDVNVTAGQQLFVRLVGTNQDVDLTAANLIQASGSSIQVFGTSGVDHFAIDVQKTLSVTVNDVTYQFNTSTTSTINLQGGDGHDTVTVAGNTGVLKINLNDVTTRADLAYRLDQDLGLSLNKGRADNSLGLGEKWLIGSDGSQYFVTADGSLLRWNAGQSGAAAGTLVAKLDATYHADLSKLWDAKLSSSTGNTGSSGSSSSGSTGQTGSDNSASTELQRRAYEFDQQLGLKKAGDYFANWAGLKEKWMTDKTGKYYFLTTDGKLYRWNGSLANASASTLVAAFDASFHADPTKLHDAKAPVASPSSGSGSNGSTGSGGGNSGSSSNGGNGTSGGSSSSAGSGSSSSGGASSGSNNSSGTSTSNSAANSLAKKAAELDKQLGLKFTGNYQTNWAGMKEKWISDSAGKWYFLTPDGSFYRWNGSLANAAKSTLVATFDASFYATPQKLHDAALTAMSNSPLTGMQTLAVDEANAADHVVQVGSGAIDVSHWTVSPPSNTCQLVVQGIAPHAASVTITAGMVFDEWESTAPTSTQRAGARDQLFSHDRSFLTLKSRDPSGFSLGTVRDDEFRAIDRVFDSFESMFERAL